MTRSSNASPVLSQPVFSMLGKLRNINLRAKVSKYEVSDKCSQPRAEDSCLGEDSGAAAVSIMTPAEAAVKSSPAHLYSASDLDICGICTSAKAKYRCPSCFVNYCSSGCYANHSNNCTESFSKARIKSVFDLEKNIKRYDDNRNDDDIRSKDTPQKAGNNNNLLHDEEEDEEEEEEEDEELLELVELLSSSNFNISSLTPEQQQAVHEKVGGSRGGRKLLNGLIRKNMSLYRPYWQSSSGGSGSSVVGITEITGSGSSDIIGTGDMLSSVSTLRAELGLRIKERQSKLTVVRTIRLSENLSYQLAVVLLAYAMIKRRTNGDLFDERVMCTEFLITISLNNRHRDSSSAPPFQPPNISEMLIGFMANVSKFDRRIERKALKSLLRDDLLRLLSNSKYVVYCLLECWLVCCSVLQLHPEEEASEACAGVASEEEEEVSNSNIFQEQLLKELRSAEQMNNIFDRRYGGKIDPLLSLLDSYYELFSKPKVPGAHSASDMDAVSYDSLDSFCRKLYFLLLAVLTESTETERDVRRLHIFLSEYIDTYLQDVE